jgi:diguanylate cyclase (GGDEF)-like protein
MERYDELTGLYNGEGFFGKVKEELMKADNKKKYLIICFDIKNFKLVNHIFGIRTGNVLLAKIGEKLKQYKQPEEICSRLEKDRFGIFTSSEAGQKIVDMLLESTFHVGADFSYPVHIDVGIYEITDRTMPVSDMCDRAGIALASIKENLMEKVSVYNEQMYENILKEHEFSMELPGALDKGEIQMYLQPQFSQTGSVMGAEALVRWEHPQKGMLVPAEFLPVFENNYMIAEIDRYIWRLACELLQRWHQEGKDDWYVSVNISPRDFECMDVYRILIELVQEYQIDFDALRVEITESSIMQNPQKQMKLIVKLRKVGFHVEMDDFGNGYSSLSMLKDIMIDAVKLDMNFLGSTSDEERKKEILKSIVELVKKLDMTIIAEGVETKEELNYLKEIGCDVFQGFYFAKPMKVESFEKQY